MPKFQNFRLDEKNPVSPDDLLIRCGEYDLRNDTIEKYPIQQRYVESFSIDPFYHYTKYEHDVAVIHTKEPFNQGIQIY